MLKKCSFFLKNDQKLLKNSKNLKKTAKNGGKLNAAKSLVYCLSIGKYLIDVYISIGKLNTFVPGKTIKLKSYFDRSTKLRTIFIRKLNAKIFVDLGNFRLGLKAPVPVIFSLGLMGQSPCRSN